MLSAAVAAQRNAIGQMGLEASLGQVVAADQGSSEGGGFTVGSATGLVQRTNRCQRSTRID